MMSKSDGVSRVTIAAAIVAAAASALLGLVALEVGPDTVFGTAHLAAVLGGLGWLLQSAWSVRLAHSGSPEQALARMFDLGLLLGLVAVAPVAGLGLPTGLLISVVLLWAAPGVASLSFINRAFFLSVLWTVGLASLQASEPSWLIAVDVPLLPVLAVLCGVLGVILLQRFPMLPLQSKLLCALLAVAVSVVGVNGALQLQHEQASHAEHTHQTLELGAQTTVSRIDAFLDATTAALRSDSSLPLFRDLLSKPPEQRVWAEIERANGMLGQLAVRDPEHIQYLSLVDAGGTVVADTRQDGIGLSRPDRECLTEVLTSGPRGSAVVVERGGARVLVCISAPVRDAEATVVGALLVTYDAQTLRSLVAKSDGIAGPRSFAILLDPQRYVLVHAEAADTTRGDGWYALHEELRPIRQDRELREIRAGLHLRGAEAVGVLQELQHVPWTVVFAQDAMILDAPYEKSKSRLLFFGFASVGFAAALAWLLGHIVAQPVLSLTGVVSRFRHGETGVRAEVLGSDEVGSLAAAYNSMADQVEELLRKMEGRTAQIEHALKATEVAKVEMERVNQELSRSRDLAEEANRAKSVFLANMSHELRTPLNAIIGYSELVLEESDDPDVPAVMKDVRRIRAAGIDLLGIISDILDLSKIEAGRMGTVVEDVFVRELIDDVVRTLEPAINKNGNALVVQVSPSVETMLTDRQKLRQCLVNLVANAAKFTSNGQVTLKASLVAYDGRPTVSFVVQDTGIGIAADQVESLFRPFAQADASTTRKYGGTGLGLTITRRLVELLGGSVRVSSIEGVGSTFVLDVPRELPEATR